MLHRYDLFPSFLMPHPYPPFYEETEFIQFILKPCPKKVFFWMEISQDLQCYFCFIWKPNQIRHVITIRFVKSLSNPCLTCTKSQYWAVAEQGVWNVTYHRAPSSDGEGPGVGPQGYAAAGDQGTESEKHSPTASLIWPHELGYYLSYPLRHGSSPHTGERVV